MKKICRLTERIKQRKRGLYAIGMAFLLLAATLLPVMPVYAEENLYEVQAGDCLWKIAERFLGDGARYTDLAAWNEEQIQDPNLIYPGMVLRIMTTAGNADMGTNTGADRNTGTDAESETDADTGTGPDTETDPSATTDMQDTLGETLEDMSIFGTINGSSWENTWLGMRFDAPEGFRLTPSEEFFDDTEEDADDDDDLTVFVEFVAESTEYLGTTAFFALGESEDTPEEYMEEVKPIAEEAFNEGLAVDVEWSEGETVELGGRSFEHFIASSELLGYEICQDYYITKQEDIICLFYILYVDGMTEKPDILLDAFSEYSDNSGDRYTQADTQKQETETDEDIDEGAGKDIGKNPK